MKFNFLKSIYLFIVLFLLLFTNISFSKEANVDLLKPSWSFDGFFGKFDRASLQRGYQIYKEVCSSCHSMKQLSYRNLGEQGGPEFTEAEVKAIASQYEVSDGPNAEGEMFTRKGKPSDKFKSPYSNENASKWCIKTSRQGAVKSSKPFALGHPHLTYKKFSISQIC